MSGKAPRALAVAVAAAGLFAVAGCQGDDTPDTSSVAETRSPAPDEATGISTSAPTSGTSAEETAAAETSPEKTAGAVSTPTADTTPPPSEEAAAPTSVEEEDADEESPVGDVIIVQDGAVFTTPAQAAFCSLSAPTGGMAATLSCEVAQSSVPAGEELMGFCPADGYGWYFNFFEDVGHGGFGCNHHDGIVHLYGEDLAADPWVNQASVHVTASGTRVPILDYGRVLRAGNLSCSVQPDGLTCASPVTGRGFTVNSASYVSW